MKPNQAFGPVSAARILGLPLPAQLLSDSRVHLIVPEGVNLPRRPGVVTRIVPSRFWRVEMHLGVPVPHPTLLFCLMSRDLQRSAATSAASDLLALGDALVTLAKNYPNRLWRGALASRAELESAVAGWARSTGASMLREVTPQIREAVESPYESIMRLVLHDSGYPELAVQHRIVERGVEIARADCADVEARIAYDFEGLGHVGSADQWRRDIQRARQVTSLEWHSERLTLIDLWPDPTAFVRYAHELRARRLQLLGK